MLPNGTATSQAVLLSSDNLDQKADFPNTRITDLPLLPLTGASGQLIMLVLGSALMLGSIGTFLVLRKRQTDKA